MHVRFVVVIQIADRASKRASKYMSPSVLVVVVSAAHRGSGRCYPYRGGNAWATAAKMQVLARSSNFATALDVAAAQLHPRLRHHHPPPTPPFFLTSLYDCARQPRLVKMSGNAKKAASKNAWRRAKAKKEKAEVSCSTTVPHLRGLFD